MKDYFYYKDNQNERKKEDDKKIIKANLVIQMWKMNKWLNPSSNNYFK